MRLCCLAVDCGPRWDQAHRYLLFRNGNVKCKIRLASWLAVDKCNAINFKILLTATCNHVTMHVQWSPTHVYFSSSDTVAVPCLTLQPNKIPDDAFVCAGWVLNLPFIRLWMLSKTNSRFRHKGKRLTQLYSRKHSIESYTFCLNVFVWININKS